MTMAFIPPYPPRPAKPVATWRGFFGERARTSVYGWSERAFEIDYLKRDILGFKVHILLDPDLIEHVLLGQAANYVKPDIVKTLLDPIIGRGLLTSDGALWRDQRKIVAASFSPGAVEAQRAMFVRAAREAMERWSEGRQDMAAEATRTTMTVIALALFGGDPRLISESSMAHIAAAIEGFSEARMLALLRLPQFPVTPKGRAGKRGQIFLRRTLAEVVDDRWHGRVARDFLTGVIEALRHRFPDEEARALAIDNAATFYLAGHETTANAISWTLFLLAAQPELQEELAVEARAALAGGADDIAERVERLRLFVQESMRLYPPVPRFDRQAIADDRIGEHEVAAGDIVSIWPWMLHRHRKYWRDPDAFDIDRFAGKGDRHRFQYLPFGGGPRTCVGAQFATAEALTILATWLAEWRFVEAGHDVRPAGMVTLRPAGGLPLRLERRTFG
ncbi:cytochrome P450 [Sphingomonas sp. RB56-2]|uniref:Cytochrome P450 n=1 Tax=Sphingomonas brevis TaxID=2908206 RepID=A0ABT0SD68_9SPHN|nr:cytochrome P450 [Sphingomonas brevis]MCL6742026.1 cytochrome P450 [Sphingomonas brevis]